MVKTVFLKNKTTLYEKLAPNFNFINYIFVFFISSFIGWVYETILGIFKYGLILSKQCILIGPFIPVYGFGAVLFMFVFSKVKNYKIFFIISMPLGAFLEFIYSYIQEKCFGTVSWEYTDYFLNIQGRTSIAHAIFWGIVGFLFLNYLLPFIFFILKKFPIKLKKIIAMSVGYAALAQQLTINGTANISASWDVKITDITAKTLTGASVKEGSPTFTNTSASFDVDLEYPGASATFDITVENAGTINATLDSISGLDTANSDDPTYITYSVVGVNNGDKLNSGDTTTATVTVTWDADQESVPENSVSKTATINLNYVQAE